jgi:hypothetical protein
VRFIGYRPGATKLSKLIKSTPTNVRFQVLVEISASAVRLDETIGRSAFNERVMAAMEKVLRHEFVPIEFRAFAYANDQRDSAGTVFTT